nr:DUF4235 domain-containing protein [Bifidobacterium xylocopae]
MSATADSAVAKFHAIDEKVDAMRSQVNADPDSLGDKLLKFALPSLAGLLAGKLFKSVWDSRNTARNNGIEQHDDGQEQESMVASLVFAALSAALTAVVSELSDRGSQALVSRRHRRS